MTFASEIRSGEIRARGLGRRFQIRSGGPRSLKETILRREAAARHDLWAVRSIDFAIAPGEALGVVGANGSGKSTLLNLIARIFAPSEGTVDVGGRVGALLGLGAGFHPEFTGVENVYLNASIYGRKRSYVDEHLDDIIAFAELEEFAHMPVKTYSSGMYTRLGFSVATHIEADILLLDEVLAVGDVSFQQKCHGKILDFKRSGGTIVFVSHSGAAVERLCDRAILLEHGRILEKGRPGEVLREYHRRLTGHAAAESTATKADRACHLIGVRALAHDGAERDRFVEGEAAIFEMRLSAQEGVHGARLTVGLREGGGRPIGSQTLTALKLRPQQPELVRLHLPRLPVREGRFVVEVKLAGEDGAELASDDRALELTVFGRDSDAEGPVHLGGVWEAGPGDNPTLVKAAGQSNVA